VDHNHKNPLNFEQFFYFGGIMQGYQLEFFMEQNKRHHHQALYEWLMDLARLNGISGATVFMGSMGFGHHSLMHSAHFFELADQPVLVTMVVKEEEANELFEQIEKENVHMFYVKMPVEFGSLGQSGKLN
jgi:PII-like signaling protein